MIPTLLAQIENQPMGDPDLGPAPVILIAIQLAIVVLLIASYWKIFRKAGQPGWAAIVPIYNVITLLKVVNRPVWWIILFLIPFVGLVMVLITMYDLSKAFGHGIGFFLGLVFLPFVFAPILAFGNSRYRGIVRAA